MTEQEARILIEGYLGDDEVINTAIEMAGKALEEIQQYQAIGTPEEFRKCMDILSKSETNELSKIIDEWLLYQKLGSAEECRAAVEKQKAKKPVQITSTKKDGGVGKCPCCGSIIGEDMIWCDDCGQRILWEV